QSSPHHPTPPSFPTRRSSDLWSPISPGGDEETTLREAETCARRAFALNPDSAQGLSIMGQVAYRRGREALRRVRIQRPCAEIERDRKSTRLNSSHVAISYAVF